MTTLRTVTVMHAALTATLAITTSACRRRSQDPPQREPPRYVTPQPRLQPGIDRVEQRASAEPIEEAHARWSEPSLLERATATATRPLNARGWSVYAALEPLRKLVMVRSIGRERESALYDLDHDRFGAERYGEPHRLARTAGVFTTFAPATQRPRYSRTYVNVRTGRAFEPRLTGPSGEPLALHWAALDEDNGMAIAMGRDGSGQLFSTRVQLERPEAELRATQVVPFAPSAYAFAGSPRALDLTRSGAASSATPRPGYECTRVRFDPEGAVRCVHYGQPTSDSYGGLRPMVLDETYFDDHAPRTTMHIATRTQRATPFAGATHCQTLKQLRNPPRALITCAENRSRGFYLWSPLRWQRWSEAEDLHYRMGDGAQFAEILESFEPSLEGLTDQWIDMERAVLVHTEPLQQLRFSSHRDRTEWLQRRDAQRRLELIVLDVEQRSLQVVARFDDCPAPGYLAMDAESDGLAVFGCQVQPDPNYFRFRFRWMRAADLRTRKLYAVQGQVAAILPAQRELLVSSSLTAAAESANPLGTLRRMQLVRPEPR